MDLLIKGRGNGKTIDLIKLSGETRIPIVALNSSFVNDFAKNIGVDIPEALSYWDHDKIAKNCKSGIYIDEFPIILQRLLGAKPIAGTMTPSSFGNVF